MKHLLTILALATLLTPLEGADRLTGARQFLDEHRVYTQKLTPPANFAELHTKIAGSRDPGTKFGPYIFALANPKAKVLSEDQLAKVKAVIAARGASPVNWHDARNVVRVQSLITMWAYVAETDPAKTAALEKEWNAWNDLRLAYMFEEFVAQERFQRAAWAVFTPEQKHRLIAGELDAHIKKSTGHSRAFSAQKQVLKVLGKPMDKAAFDEVTARWEKKWESVADQTEAAAKFDRQREMAMDDADEAFAVAAWSEQETAFRAFAQGERDAIRDLVQASYQKSPDLTLAIAKVREQLRAQMVEKYGEHAGVLLRQLGEIK